MANQTNAQKKIYSVLAGVLKHDGKKHRKGSHVALSDAHAAPLLKLKVVEPAAEPATK